MVTLDEETKQFFLNSNSSAYNLHLLYNELGAETIRILEEVAAKYLGYVCDYWFGDLVFFAYVHGLCDSRGNGIKLRELEDVLVDRSKWKDEYLFWVF